MFDGTLARATGRVSNLGAFMDSVFDRAGEVDRLRRASSPGSQALGVADGDGPRRGGPGLGGPGQLHARRSRRASASRTGTGMAAIGIMPREVRLVILSLGLILAGLLGTHAGRLGRRPCAGGAGRPARRRSSSSSPSGSSPSAPPSPSSSGSSTSASQARRPIHPDPPGARRTNVSKNGSNGKNGATPGNTWAGVRASRRRQDPGRDRRRRATARAASSRAATTTRTPRRTTSSPG